MTRITRFADIILVSIGVTCVAFLTFNLIAHGFAWHYVLLGAAAMLTFGTLALREPYRLNLALLLISLLVPVYFCEAILAWGVVSPLRFSPTDWLNFPSDWNAQEGIERMLSEARANATYDTRTRLEVVYDLREHGIAAYPLIFPEVMFQPGGPTGIKSLFTVDHQELLPLAGLSNTPTVFCNESGEYIVYESDRHGFHNGPDAWEGPVELVALGDSFTHGACVPSEKGFVAVLRSRYPSTVNLGMNGDGPLAMLATLREYGSALKPHTVLWVYFEGNDMRDLDSREKHSRLLMNYLDPSFSQHLMGRQRDINRVLTEYLDDAMRTNALSYGIEEFLKLQYLRGSARQFLKNRRPDVDGVAAEVADSLRVLGAPSKDQDLELFRSILLEAKRSVGAWGGRIHFVYLPSWERYRVPNLANKDRDHILRIVKNLGIPLIDVHPVFSRHPDPLSLFPGRRYAHYTAAGHRLVADVVISHLAGQQDHLSAAAVSDTPAH